MASAGRATVELDDGAVDPQLRSRVHLLHHRHAGVQLVLGDLYLKTCSIMWVEQPHHVGHRRSLLPDDDEAAPDRSQDHAFARHRVNFGRDGDMAHEQVQCHLLCNLSQVTLTECV